MLMRLQARRSFSRSRRLTRRGSVASRIILPRLLSMLMISYSRNIRSFILVWSQLSILRIKVRLFQRRMMIRLSRSRFIAKRSRRRAAFLAGKFISVMRLIRIFVHQSGSSSLVLNQVKVVRLFHLLLKFRSVMHLFIPSLMQP